MLTREKAIKEMVENYDKARAQVLADKPELFGKALDNKARKLALKLAGIALPKGLTIAWATPDRWGHAGYRGTNAQKMIGNE